MNDENINAFGVYSTYVALKLHFSSAKYDAVKFNYKVRTNVDSFRKRRDAFIFERLCRKYKKKSEVINYIVSNFIAGNAYGGVFNFDDSTEKTYSEWQKRMQSISYSFKQDCQKIRDYIESNNLKFKDLLENKENEYPLLVRLYFHKTFSIETFIIFDEIFAVLNKFTFSEPFWDNERNRLIKYKPFCKIGELKKFRKIIVEVFDER